MAKWAGIDAGRIKSFGLKPGTKINGYVVCRRLGRGFEGEVYLVREVDPQGLRVLKLYDHDRYPFRQLYPYGRKLESLANVSGIVGYFHCGYWEPRNCHYLILDYVVGRSLERIRGRCRMPFIHALRIVRELCFIVRDCHETGVRVGDISSDNIILTVDDRPVIVDLDWRSRLTRCSATEDIIAVVHVLHRLIQHLEPPSGMFRRRLPKRRNAIVARYKSAQQLLQAIHEIIENGGR